MMLSALHIYSACIVGNLALNTLMSCCVALFWFALLIFFFFQAEDGIRDLIVTGVQTCALPIFERARARMREQRLGATDGALKPGLAALGERPVAREMHVLVRLADVLQFAPDEKWLVERNLLHRRFIEQSMTG